MMGLWLELAIPAILEWYYPGTGSVFFLGLKIIFAPFRMPFSQDVFTLCAWEVHEAVAHPKRFKSLVIARLGSVREQSEQQQHDGARSDLDRLAIATALVGTRERSVWLDSLLFLSQLREIDIDSRLCRILCRLAVTDTSDISEVLPRSFIDHNKLLEDGDGDDGNHSSGSHSYKNCSDDGNSCDEDKSMEDFVTLFFHWALKTASLYTQEDKGKSRCSDSVNEEKCNNDSDTNDDEGDDSDDTCETPLSEIKAFIAMLAHAVWTIFKIDT